MQGLKLFFLLSALLFLLFPSGALANSMVITGKYVIDQDTTFSNMMLDLTQGYFEIRNNAKLELDHCIVTGLLSPDKPQLLHLYSGGLILKKNRFRISTLGIPKNPDMPSVFSVFRIHQGQVKLVANDFTIAQPYTASLLVTDELETSDFTITHNHLRFFHGGFILKNVHRVYFGYNQFKRVSITGIFLFKGSHAILEKNKIFFAGNNNVGDGIDLIDSEDVLVNQNYLASGSCYSIVVLRGKRINLESNMVMGGITYAIYISSSGLGRNNAALISLLKTTLQDPKAESTNLNIRVADNYVSQNRYGLTAIDTSGLIVENNIFIQKFANAKNRSFWTDNKVLLQNVKELTWRKNWYKEAYSQEGQGQEAKSSQLTEFPLSGGVRL